MTQPDIRVTLDTTIRAGTATGSDGNLDQNFVQWFRCELEVISAHPDKRPSPSDRQRRGCCRYLNRLRSNSMNTIELVAVLQDGNRVIRQCRAFSRDGERAIHIRDSVVLEVYRWFRFGPRTVLGASIRDFADAAERLGTDLTAPPLTLRGPRELRTTSSRGKSDAAKIERFLEDRTRCWPQSRTI